MPQDTTIYWDGYDDIPAQIDSLPATEKLRVLQAVEKRKQELLYSDPSWIYISLFFLILFFGYFAIKSRRR